LIFQESIRINGNDGKQDEGTVDTTVQKEISLIPLIINCIEK